MYPKNTKSAILEYQKHSAGAGMFVIKVIMSNCTHDIVF